MSEQRLVYIASFAKCSHCPLKIDSIPQGDGRNDQVQVAGAVSLILERGIADFAESIKEHSAGERIAGLSFVQRRLAPLCFVLPAIKQLDDLSVARASVKVGREFAYYPGYKLLIVLFHYIRRKMAN